MDLTVEHIRDLISGADSVFSLFHQAFISACDKEPNHRGAQKNDDEEIARRFLKMVRSVDADLVSDYEEGSFVQRDALKTHWSEFLVQFGANKLQVSNSTFAVSLKRAIIQAWVQSNYIPYKASEYAEHRRLFSAFVLLSDPKWFNEEKFLGMHMGVTNWEDHLKEHLSRFEQLDLIPESESHAT